MLHVYTYAIHVILIISVVYNSFLVTNWNLKITFFFLVPLPPLILFVREKKLPNALEIVSTKIQGPT
jgi:hypothetical protein